MAAKQRNLTGFLLRSFLWSGLACTVVLLAAMAFFQADLQTHRLLYRLEPHQGKTNPDLPQRTAAVLRRRLEAMEENFGLRDARVSTGPENVLDLRFSTRAEIEEVLFWLTLPARVRLSLLHPDTPTLKEKPVEDPPAGYAVRTYTRYMYRLSRPGDLKAQEYYYLVGEEPVMAVSRFEHVDLSKVGLHQRTRLVFRFISAEALQFQDVTALNVGRQMVMLVDDRLFFPPKEISRAIEGDAVQVEGYFYNPPLRKLVKILNTGPLPGKLTKVSHRIE